MERLPLVSIVTPSFNIGRYLEATIESVLSQDYPAVEYIVMDGGSTDNSIEIIRRYADRLAYWTSGPDGGHSAAITTGWKLSHGEILAEIDASDLLTPQSISRAVAALQTHPDWGMVYSDSEWIDEDSTTLHKWQSRPFKVEDMLCGNYIAQPTVFIRRSALEAVGYYDPAFTMSMDFDLWMRIGLSFPVGYLHSAILGVMRAHADSKTQKCSKQWLLENLRVIEVTLDHPSWRMHKARLMPQAVACAYARHASYCVRDGDYAEARATLWAILKTKSLKPWRSYGRDLLIMAAISYLGPHFFNATRRFKRRLVGQN